MEVTRYPSQKPSLTLHRTKMLLEHLATCYNSTIYNEEKAAAMENDLSPENSAARANYLKSIKEYLLQVSGFVATACEYIEYFGMDVPPELQNFVEDGGKLHDSCRQINFAQVVRAKKIIEQTLRTIESLHE